MIKARLLPLALVAWLACGSVVAAGREDLGAAARTLSYYSAGKPVAATAALDGWDALARVGIVPRAASQSAVRRLKAETWPGLPKPAVAAARARVEALSLRLDLAEGELLADREDAKARSHLKRVTGLAEKAAAALERDPSVQDAQVPALRMRVVAAAARTRAGDGIVADAMAPLLEQALSPAAGDGVAFNLAFGTVAKACAAEGDKATLARLQEWQRRAEARWPDAQVANATGLVLGDCAEASGDRPSLLAGFRSARVWLDTVPPQVLDPAQALDVAAIADGLKDPAETGWARGFALAVIAAADGRGLDRYFEDLDDAPDATIAGLGRWLGQAGPAENARLLFRARLAMTLATHGRAGELGTVDLAPLLGLAARQRIARAGKGDVAKLIRDASLAEDNKVEAEASLRRALDLAKQGGDPLLVIQVVFDLVGLLGDSGRLDEARTLLRSFAADMGRTGVLSAAARAHLYSRAAEWSERTGDPTDARGFRDRAAAAPSDEAWAEVERALADGALSASDLRTRFAAAVSRNVRDGRALGGGGRLADRLNRTVPKLAGRLSRQGSENDVALFAAPYSRALAAAGEVRAAGAAKVSGDDGYAPFCAAMVAAGDARFGSPEAACLAVNAEQASATEAEERARQAIRGGSPPALRGEALLAALQASVATGREEAGLRILADALSEPRLHEDAWAYPVTRATMEPGWGRAWRKRIVDVMFPPGDSLVEAIEGLAGAGQDATARQRDMALAATVAAAIRGGAGEAVTAAPNRLSRLANGPLETPAERLAAALAATALAFAEEGTGGLAASAETRRAAHTALQALDPDLRSRYLSVLGLLQTATSRDGAEADRAEHLDRDLLDALARGAGRPPERGSNLELIDPWRVGLTSERCGLAFGSLGPTFLDRERGPDRPCLRAAARVLDGVLATLAADLAARRGRDEREGANLDRFLASRAVGEVLSALDPGLLRELPDSAAGPLLGLVWGDRPSGDQDLAGALLAARQAGGSASAVAHGAWVRDSRAFHRALASEADPAQVRVASTRADQAWAAFLRTGASASAAARRPPDTIDVKRIQAALRSDEALISYLLPNIGAAAVIRRDRVAIVPLDLDPDELGRDVAVFRSSIDPAFALTRAVRVDLGFRLHSRLIAPLRSHLDGATRLLLDLPQALAPIPFGALVTEPPTSASWTPDSAESPTWAIARWSMLAVAHPMLVPAVRDGAPKSIRDVDVLLAGAPTLPDRAAEPVDVARLLATEGAARAALVRTQFAALPGAPEELARIAAGRERATVIEGAAFTAGALAAASTPARTHILLATHAETTPEGSALIVTTPSEAPDGGIVSDANIAGWALDAELVVLSACKTGASTGGTASLGSLTASLQRAGARRVVTTLWPIVSDAASLFTVPMMRDALGTLRADPAEAMAKAARALAGAPVGDAARHPAFWAGFLLSGEP